MMKEGVRTLLGVVSALVSFYRGRDWPSSSYVVGVFRPSRIRRVRV